ncbi:penicillin-binding protein, transpeptidase [Geitlerinema sp. PCC 7407]|nr:penicillin-binding protein, transpeptidase [Geitlerinema sp. PCC 7407]
MPDQGKPSKEPQAERVPAVKRQRRKGKAARQRPEPATQAMKEAPPALSLPNGGGSLPVRSGGRSPKPPSASPRSDLRRLLLGRSAVRKGAPAAAMPRPSQPSAGARADASQARLEELRSRRRRSRRRSPKAIPTAPGSKTVYLRPRPADPPAPILVLPKKVSPLLYIMRLLILGVGIGVIAGTLLSVWDPATRSLAETPQESSPAQKRSLRWFGLGPKEAATAQAEESKEPAPPALKLGAEIAPLKAEIQTIASQNTQLSPAVLVVDLDSDAHVDINAAVPLPAASTIKIPILVAFFQDVDAGKIRLDEQLTMRQELVASGSGEMQYQPPGTQFTALETATKMITVSDNTATNMLIERLGGMASLNQRFQAWGLPATALRNPLPDLEGTNTTSPHDLVQVMALVNRGDLMSQRSRDRLLSIMHDTVNDSLLPQGLGEGAIIAHKTGDIGSLLADAGLVDMPSGKRYLIAVMVKRPHNADAAYELIQQISKATYQALSKPAQPQPSTGGVPATQPATATQADATITARKAR